MIYKFKEIS